jgi:hypothetical protein
VTDASPGGAPAWPAQEPPPEKKPGKQYWKRAVPGAGAVFLLDQLAKAGELNRMRSLADGLSDQGIVIDWNNPAEVQALADYSNDLGGTSFLRRNFYPPMPEAEARAKLKEALEKAKPKVEEKTDAPPKPHTRTKGNVSVKEKKDPDRPCKTGRYGSLKCDPDEQAHHIVPDYTLRYGNRDEGIAGQKRIPGMPSFRDGPAICLSGYSKNHGDEHGIAHLSDGPIAGLGGTSGVAPISDITDEAVKGAIQARPKCRNEIIAEVKKQPSLGSSIMGRTTIKPPGDWPPGSGNIP